MNEGKKKSKLIGYILGIIAFVAVAAGATYAWLTWRSNNIVISGSSECFDVIYTKRDLGTQQNPAKIRFMESYVGADYAEVNISLDPNCADVLGVGKLYLTTNVNTDAAILTGGLYYTLTSVINNEETVLQEGAITATGDILLTDGIVVDSTSSNITYRVYVWINGPITTSQSYVGASYAGQIRAEVVSSEVKQSAATYITNLYKNASKTTVDNGPGGEEITYNYASSVSLMNDRLGGTTQSLDGGNIRYYGANPNNYVWLGDTYQSTYTFNFNGVSVTREANSKKLWRIIGVFDGRLKLIQADPLPVNLSWDTSDQSVNNGYGINEWSQADLMKLLNEGYTGTNGSLYWNKGNGLIYNGRSNAVSEENVSFANTGLSSVEKNLISSATWYLGAYETVQEIGNASYANVQYAAERQSTKLGKICTQGDNKCDDTVIRTATWNGKVGLMYTSDYGYATDFSVCTRELYNYNAFDCYSNDWLTDTSHWQWTMSTRANSISATYAFFVHADYVTGGTSVSDARNVRPVVYLKSGVTISSGTGTESDPYVIS